MLSKDIFVPLTICIDQTRRALVIVLPCYGALEIVGVIIIIIIIPLTPNSNLMSVLRNLSLSVTPLIRRSTRISAAWTLLRQLHVRVQASHPCISLSESNN